uniref:Uncharacterized protein n=1 Tax=Panagrellus redivivus TaxID=6233 RepID=A0A7E4W6Z6_PANRE
MSPSNGNWQRSVAQTPGQPPAVAVLQRRKLALKLVHVAWVDPAHMPQHSCLYDFLNLAMRNDSISTCSGVFLEVGIVGKVNPGSG